MGPSPQNDDERGQEYHEESSPRYSSDTTITQNLLTPNLAEKEKGYDMSGSEDLESQRSRGNKESTSGQHAAEYGVPAKQKYFFLGLYFALNLSLTLFNKAVLGKFPFPWLLTAIHTSTAALGCSALLWRGQFELSSLSTRENMTLLAFSVLYTVNIAISNVSL